ncbi:urease subunit beta [Actinacidiphila sp. ITFR-21]|uniref:urease subunit beta n=1 Tax=Actinacidiphila sp. ITFR-21 TaxID=3075199 RepID=UPI00288BC6FA|nr:urease subunit beta [Streptomyces sp. ITFR-21]WNI16192.1 urease subunit beta [Streptomyces sp. ITFR-21]
MTTPPTYIYGEEPIEINAGRRTVTLTVSNTGDRAIQVGSHYHFFEVNSALAFDRRRALGMHLNIPAGTSVRIEPGGSREVELCAYAGTGRLVGFSGLLNGSLASRPARVEAVRRAIEEGFQGAQGPPETTTSSEARSSRGTAATSSGPDAETAPGAKGRAGGAGTARARGGPSTEGVQNEKKGSR